MADPVELQIVEKLRERLAVISVAAGYHTNAGSHVHLGRIIDDEHDELPAIVVWIAEQVPASARAAGVSHMRLSVTIEGIINASDTDPLADAIRIAADIMRAVHVGEQVLVQGCQPLELAKVEYFPPDEGSHAATGQVTIAVPYVRNLRG